MEAITEKDALHHNGTDEEEQAAAAVETSSSSSKESSLGDEGVIQNEEPRLTYMDELRLAKFARSHRNLAIFLHGDAFEGALPPSGESPISDSTR